MDNSLSREESGELSFEIRTGDSEDEDVDASQASDDPEESLREAREDFSSRYEISAVSEGELPPEELVSSNASVSIADYLALCQIVEAEAQSEDTYGKRLVANVVLNRLNSSRYPDEIENVILDEGQFKPVGTGVYYKTVPTEEAKYA
ncbi:MAG: cell wall hydrolase, partial [Lachnospiraceae bacterium]|nr:cell wall hydrolase [Lachnospiraceae bacterium]